MSTGKKILTWFIVAVVLAAGGFSYFKFFFVFGEGVKAGELNQIVNKGWIWKTNEGRLIQTGFKSAKAGGTIQSNEFNFSVVDQQIADSLMHCSGKIVELHYREYNGTLPWRGMQKYIVDGIVSVTSVSQVSSDLPYTTGGETAE